MSEDELVDALVETWETLRQSGTEPSAEVVCRDWPHLIDKFKERRDKLKLFENAFGHHPVGTAGDQPQPGEFCHGRYEIGLLHDQGGLGAVYLARDKELGRTVLVKAIRPDAQQRPAYRRQFVNEATITGQLDHPGVVPVFGFGCDQQDRPYYAMRMIRGATMREPIRQFHSSAAGASSSNLALQRLLRDFLSVCQTIHFAHSRGVIHRDIKPTNIMVGRFGEVIVVDWGLAKHLSAAEVETTAPGEAWDAISPPHGSDTREGEWKGSPIYMSPEQAEGNVAAIGTASDIYGLGATLYEILTGRPPFDGAAKDLLKKVIAGDFVPPRAITDSIPPALDAICLKALARDPRDRYPTAKALADDLENYLADEPVSVYPEPFSEQVRRWARRHRAVASGVAASVLVALVALLGVATLLARHNRDLSVAKSAADKARTAAEIAEQGERRRATELESSLYVNQFMLAGASWKNADLRRTRDLLLATKPELRSLEWNLAVQQTQSPPLLSYYVSRPTSDFVTALHWNSSGNWLHVENLGPLPTQSALIRSHRLLSTQGILPKLGAAAGFLAFSPDGTQYLRRIPAGEDKKYRLSLVELATGSAVWQSDVLEVKSYNLFTAGFFVRDPDRDQALTWLTDDPATLVVVATDKWANLPGGGQGRILQLDFRDVKTGRLIHSLDGDNVGNATSATFDPAGRLIALRTSAPGTHTVDILSATTGKKLYTLSGHTARINSVAFSRDSKRIATASDDRSARIWDGVTGKPLAAYWGSGGPVLAVALNSASETIAAAGEDSAVRLWNVASGKLLRVVPVNDDEVFALAFGTDDKFLYFGGTEGPVREVDLNASPAAPQTLIQENDYVQKVRYDARGKALAAVVSGAASAVRVYDSTTRALKFQIDLLDPQTKSAALYIEDLAYAPDGSSLAVAGDNFIRVVAADSGEKHWELRGYGGPLAYTPDGKSLLAYRASRTLFEIIKSEKLVPSVRDEATRKWLNIVIQDNILSPADEVIAERLGREAANQPLLATLQEQARAALVVLAADTGKPERVLPASLGYRNRFAMHPNEPVIAVAVDDRLVIWDLAKGSQSAAFAVGQGALLSLSFSPSGKQLVVVGVEQKAAAIFDIASGLVAHKLTGHAAPIQDAQFSSDGRRLITCTADGEVAIWDAASAAQLWAFEASSAPLYSIALTKDGWHLAVAGGEPKAASRGVILGWMLVPPK